MQSFPKTVWVRGFLKNKNGSGFGSKEKRYFGMFHTQKICKKRNGGGIHNRLGHYRRLVRQYRSASNILTRKKTRKC